MKQLPLFPLKIVLLPKEKISLHIFEDRYKKMIHECIKNQSMFGLVLSMNDKIEKIGCAAKVSTVTNQFDNGEYDIVAEGVARFQVKNIRQDESLNIGSIEYIADETICHDYDLIKDVKEKYIQILLLHQIDTDLDIEMKKQFAFELTERILLPLNVKQLLLEIDDETERLCVLNDIFDGLLRKLSSSRGYEKPDMFDVN